jgi:Ni/Fe-hydrogenase subunit HybB-like protein
LEGPAGDPREESIGDLFGRLVEDGRAYAEAELALIKAIAEYRAQRAGRALAALAAGAVLLVSAVTALVIGLVTGLSQYMSPFLAGLLAAAALAAGGWFLIDRGLTGMKGLGRDKAEQQAIDKGTQS